MTVLLHTRRKLSKAGHLVLSRLPKTFAPQYHVNGASSGVVNLIDIGAAGVLPEPWVNNADRIKLLLTFEPNGGAETDGNVIHLNEAIWEHEESRPFYIYGVDGDKKAHGSSLFEQNVEYVEQNWAWLQKLGPKSLAKTWVERAKLQDTVVIDCRSLDSILSEHAATIDFHFAKIDVQGAELPILRGATEFLTSTCVGLQLELFKLPLYKGAPLIDEVIQYLDTYGFELAFAEPAHGTFDSQHECLFLHRSRSPEIRREIESIYGLRSKVKEAHS